MVKGVSMMRTTLKTLKTGMKDTKMFKEAQIFDKAKAMHIEEGGAIFSESTDVYRNETPKIVKNIVEHFKNKSTLDPASIQKYAENVLSFDSIIFKCKALSRLSGRKTMTKVAENTKEYYQSAFNPQFDTSFKTYKNFFNENSANINDPKVIKVLDEYLTDYADELAEAIYSQKYITEQLLPKVSNNGINYLFGKPVSYL